MSNELGKYLKQLRGKESLRDVSHRLNGQLSFSYISDLEKGVNRRGNPINPSPDTLRILANAYHTDYWKLMELAGYAPVPKNVRVNPTLDGAKVTADVGFELAKQNIPVYGTIHAGEPTFADQCIIGETPITDKIIDDYGKDNLFALQVKGDSMSRAVLPGYVAVLIDGDAAAIKRFRKTSRAVMFEPDSSNPVYQPIIFTSDQPQDYRILGKYIYATSMPI